MLVFGISGCNGWSTNLGGVSGVAFDVSSTGVDPTDLPTCDTRCHFVCLQR